MANRTRPHRCPGKCGHQDFQEAIQGAPRNSRAHLMAMAEACDWYREHETAGGGRG